MKTDIEIAQSVELKPITEVVEKVGIGFDDLELYGKYKAKLSFDKINAVKDNKPGKLPVAVVETRSFTFSRDCS